MLGDMPTEKQLIHTLGIGTWGQLSYLCSFILSPIISNSMRHLFCFCPWRQVASTHIWVILIVGASMIILKYSFFNYFRWLLFETNCSGHGSYIYIFLKIHISDYFLCYGWDIVNPKYFYFDHIVHSYWMEIIYNRTETQMILFRVCVLFWFLPHIVSGTFSLTASPLAWSLGIHFNLNFIFCPAFIYFYKADLWQCPVLRCTNKI